jgi:hypothetical protein
MTFCWIGGRPTHRADVVGFLAAVLASHQRFAKRLKQSAVDGIALRIVLGVPLDAGRIGNPDRLDGPARDNDRRKSFNLRSRHAGATSEAIGTFRTYSNPVAS